MTLVHRIFNNFLLVALLLSPVSCVKTITLRSNKTIYLDSIGEFKDIHGFTCTGLCYNQNDEVFYIGNIGVISPDHIKELNSSIEIIDKNFKYMGRIPIGNIFPEMKDVQGIAYDLSDSTIWFCGFDGNRVFHINKNVEHLGDFEVNRPTGIAYDSNRNSLWILTVDEICNYDKTGEKLSVYNFEKQGQDQLFYDRKEDQLLITVGGGKEDMIDLHISMHSMSALGLQKKS
jgi:DNA-binding beta-propeller fold protein YncE